MTIASARHRGERLLLVAAALVCALAYLVVAGPPAQAADCPYVDEDGNLVYCQTDPGEPGEPGEPGDPGGGGSEPTCDLQAPATFCLGAKACYWKENVVPFAPPQGPKPSPDADWRVRICDGMGEAVWLDGTEPQPPSLAEQAQTAFGELTAPPSSLSVNPVTKSLVTLPTWFWADGLTDEELTGSSAFGLVAIATPDSLRVTPGDGSASMDCPWVTSESEACAREYERSSFGRGGTTVAGHDAYAATGQAVWDVTFELNGNPVNIPGAPTEFTGPQMDAGVWVVESQALVIDRG